MISKRLMTKKFLVGLASAAVLSTAIIWGCAVDRDGEHGDGQDLDRATLVLSGTPVVSVGTHAEGSEGGGEHGNGSEGGGEEDSGAMLAPDETFDMVRGGARLILGYDAPSNTFTGTVENTTGGVLSRVRVEVHLSNGVELGPTIPVDMAPGEVAAVSLPATQASFTGWVAHAEVGGGESGGEHGSGGERREGSGHGGGERRGGG